MTTRSMRAVAPRSSSFRWSLTWSSDIGGYFFGRQFGRRKLIPSISPGKTVEGSIGAIVLAAVASIVYAHFILRPVAQLGLALGRYTVPAVILFGVTVSVVAQVGDLAESLLKREAGMKDSSTIIPGHGGILDRFDSMLFVLPVSAVLFRVLLIAMPNVIPAALPMMVPQWSDDGRTGIAILGSTGSIGTAALRVVGRHRDRFRVTALTAHQNESLLREQIASEHPAFVGIVAPNGKCDTGWTAGRDCLIEASTHEDVDIVVNAVVGAAGLEATLAALRAGKRVALANKESLVVGGPLVLEACRTGGGEIVPVDSEHSAILQCLSGRTTADVRRVILTASGGPFRGWDADQLARVTVADALRHPTWSMGRKVTIDSATLANKALEVIEAHYLFGLDYNAIDVVVHPQSVVHSFVEFVDRSVLAQLGVPSMELPILYALTHPERVADDGVPRFDPTTTSLHDLRACRTTSLSNPQHRYRCGAIWWRRASGVQRGKRAGRRPLSRRADRVLAHSAFDRIGTRRWWIGTVGDLCRPRRLPTRSLVNTSTPLSHASLDRSTHRVRPRGLRPRARPFSRRQGVRCIRATVFDRVWTGAREVASWRNRVQNCGPSVGRLRPDGVPSRRRRRAARGWLRDVGRAAQRLRSKTR